MLTLEEFICLNKRLKVAFDKALAFDNEELTKQDTNVLITIKMLKKKNGCATASDIAKQHYTTIPAVMHKLSSLEDQDFIIREEDAIDKRVRKIIFTDKAEEYIDRITLKRNKILTDYFEFLGEERVQLLKSFLDDTIAFLDRYYD